MTHAAETLAHAFGCQAAGQLVEAIAGFREATRLDPNLAAAHTGLAAILFAQQRYREAEACCRAALRPEPDSAASYSNLAAVLIKLGRFVEAESAAREAIRCDAQNAGAYNNLGNALQEQGRSEEAEACFRTALRSAPAHNDLRVSLAGTLRAQLRLGEARGIYETVLRDDPGHMTARMNRALALLQTGDWDAGWKEYEYRFKTGESAERRFRQPLWDGAPLEGRRILLYAEQGLGDTLQFVRYTRLVKERGGTVLLECQPSLTRIAKIAGGVDQAIASGSALPEFEVQAPLLSLPRIFGTTPENVPAAVPYLFADPEQVRHWHEKLAHFPGFRVGVVWSGNPRHKDDRRRSISQELLSPLAQIPGATLFALQSGSVPEGFRTIEKASPRMEDTAAIMSQMDLIISVDTMVAHLAGGLGRPVWMLLHYVPDFRWLLEREDTPWYPTMRLFRQQTAGGWQAVIERVAWALREVCRR